MKVNQLRLVGFSSFADSGWIRFSDGINIIVGQNNSGKSALLVSLRQALEDNRHRGEDRFLSESLQPPVQEIDLEVPGAQYRRAFLRRGGQIYWPFQREIQTGKESFENYIHEGTTTWKLSRTSGQQAFFARESPSTGLFHGPATIATQISARDGEFTILADSTGADTAAEVLQNVWVENSFYFDAQRFNLGRSPFSNPEQLDGTAVNLPAYLNRMQGNRPGIFRRLIEHLREIFSTVGNLSVGPVGGAELEVRVWPTEEQNYFELSFGLNSSGTGLSQAIAILTVALTMRGAVLMIDEISSFLHPAAAKSLLRILQIYYSDNQYIVTTHSAEVLSAASPSIVHFVEKDGFRSQIASVDLGNLQDLQNVAGQLGISMTDVFSAERIIWVEGSTEELCFTYLYETNNPIPHSTKFVSVVAPSDFSQKIPRRKLILDIYERLSRTTLPLVKSVTFGFDTEDLSPQQKADLIRQSVDRVRFLPRRNFESYLINASAIGSLIAEQLHDINAEDAVERVESALLASAGDPALKAKAQWKGDLSSEAWLARVDGANLIKTVCSHVSGARFSFAKSVHSLYLLQKIAASDPDSLAELRAYVGELVEISKK
ncbi:ATP-binding protein [Mesorhizobium sp. B2-3-5]|uniref:AAA family ATPase n=1 Tax=Mesorhizobium sp. B2-3-5 TaxID=2589958 RepID=UPI0015E40B3E|nr:ATP-binding protein [Mesorhizobium sp. B2-3-5]